jgi:hypothetical protein
MDIEKEIVKQYKTKYKFAKAHGLSTQNVAYWCKIGYDNLRLDTQFKIKQLLCTTTK